MSGAERFRNYPNQGNRAINAAVNGKPQAAMRHRNAMVNNIVQNANAVSPGQVNNAARFARNVDDKLAKILRILQGNLVMKPKTFTFKANNNRNNNVRN
jgi:hypothetical protein